MSASVTFVTPGRARHRAPSTGRCWGLRTLLVALAAPATATAGAVGAIGAAFVERPVLAIVGVAVTGSPMLVTAVRRYRHERRLVERRARAMTAPIQPLEWLGIDPLAAPVPDLTVQMPVFDASSEAVYVELVDIELWDAELADFAWSEAGLAEAGLAEAELADAELADAELADAELADAELADAVPADAVPVEALGRRAADRPVDARVDVDELQRIWDLGDGPDTGPLPVIPDHVIVDDGHLVAPAPVDEQAVLVSESLDSGDAPEGHRGRRSA